MKKSTDMIESLEGSGDLFFGVEYLGYDKDGKVVSKLLYPDAVYYSKDTIDINRDCDHTYIDKSSLKSIFIQHSGIGNSKYSSTRVYVYKNSQVKPCKEYSKTFNNCYPEEMFAEPDIND